MLSFLLRSTAITKNLSKAIPFYRDSEKLGAYTEFPLKMQADEQGVKVSTGRAWRAEELRLKSDEDLHKLWYVLLKEKNALESDNVLKRKMFGKTGPQGKMGKCRVSMARLLTIINERKKIREEYRKSLEEEYIAKKKIEYENALQEEQAKKANEPYVPQISFNLLRAKYHDLKRGIDNLDYIKEAIEIEQKRAAEKKYLDEKYDYKGKQIVKPDTEEYQKLIGDNNTTPEVIQTNQTIIQGFKSGILQQLNSGRYKISQEEVLRMHIKNWKMLNLKQKRKVLGELNARRAMDAKKEFLKELNLLGQKIAYDQGKKSNANANQQLNYFV